ncbi:hypothetical protein Pcinc_011795 [Petrolisthes cinctipes]|uniref:Neurotransmitter-gated ion-channel transmembrane domain-containing protein n=1 Tax=Petrolisthes cinctipes TaxID=88211 RepID=A0AAE1G2Y8_PETCI|nr:hypothetical protein Pcinc_011795 [Petrolisthes cinctipes]
MDAKAAGKTWILEGGDNNNSGIGGEPKGAEAREGHRCQRIQASRSQVEVSESSHVVWCSKGREEYQVTKCFLCVSPGGFNLTLGLERRSEYHVWATYLPTALLLGIGRGLEPTAGATVVLLSLLEFFILGLLKAVWHPESLVAGRGQWGGDKPTRSWLPADRSVNSGYGTLFLPVESFPERGGMSLTTLLVLISLYTETASTLPKTPYLKLIDIWFVFNIVYLSLIITTHLVACRKPSHPTHKHRKVPLLMHYFHEQEKEEEEEKKRSSGPTLILKGDGQGDGRDAGADKDEEGDDGIDAVVDNKDRDSGIAADSGHTEGENDGTDVEGFGVSKGEVTGDRVGEEGHIW